MTFESAHPIHGELKSKLDKTEGFTHLSPYGLMEVDVAAHRAEVNTLLLKASELVRTEVCRQQKIDMGRQKTFGRRADLAAADLRKADLRGVSLRGACLIAADLDRTDFRDADIRGVDLSKSIFLTQGQINAAKGDTGTKLPPSLNRPAHWGD